MHGLVELVTRPIADSGLSVGRDVGRVDHPKWGLESQSAGQGFAALTQVAGHAIARRHQILSATQLGGVRHRVGDRLREKLRRENPRDGVCWETWRDLADGETGDTQEPDAD